MCTAVFRSVCRNSSHNKHTLSIFICYWPKNAVYSCIWFLYIHNTTGDPLTQLTSSSCRRSVPKQPLLRGLNATHLILWYTWSHIRRCTMLLLFLLRAYKICHSNRSHQYRALEIMHKHTHTMFPFTKGSVFRWNGLGQYNVLFVQKIRFHIAFRMNFLLILNNWPQKMGH